MLVNIKQRHKSGFFCTKIETNNSFAMVKSQIRALSLLPLERMIPLYTLLMLFLAVRDYGLLLIRHN